MAGRKVVLAWLATVVAAMTLPVGSNAAVLASTPYMGWNPYYSNLGGSNEATFESVAESLISTGLQQAGYRIFWLDYGWASGARDSNGNLIISSTQWPNGMSGFTTWLHQHGFLAGIYTDAGTSGCSNSGVGSYGHYAAGSTNPYSLDADQFAAWGFDAVKVDFCGAGQKWLDESPNDPRTLYRLFSQALANSGRPMILNVANFWTPGQIDGTAPSFADSSWDNYSWAPTISQSWRTDTDIGFPNNVVFTNVLRNLGHDTGTSSSASQPGIQTAAGPGHWNDPDYLVPQAGMTDTQAQSQFSMWAMVAAPLILGSDPRSLSSTSISMLKNSQVIAIDQDSLGAQGYLLSGQGTTAQVWVKPLANGDRAVALLNTGSSSQQISTTASAIGMPSASQYRLLDVWTNTTTTTTGQISAPVQPDAVVLYRVGLNVDTVAMPDANSEPTGIAVDTVSHVAYVDESAANAVARITSTNGSSFSGTATDVANPTLCASGCALPGLNFPDDLALDSSGHVFASDFCVGKTSGVCSGQASGTTTTVSQQTGSSTGQGDAFSGCSYPSGEAVSGGRLFLACAGSGVVASCSTSSCGSGAALVALNKPTIGSPQPVPSGVADIPTETSTPAVVVADARNSTLSVVSLSGSTLTASAPSQLGGGCEPAYVAVGPASGGTAAVYVACPGNGTIETGTISGTTLGSFTATSLPTTGTSTPRDFGIAINAAGTLLAVSDSANADTVMYPSVSGTSLGADAIAGVGGVPDAVAIDTNNVFVANETSGTVSVIDPSSSDPHGHPVHPGRQRPEVSRTPLIAPTPNGTLPARRGG